MEFLPDTRKEAILVVGAPRSGTSATTGVLQIQGLELGDDLVGPEVDNIKGHFEDAATVELNRAIIRLFDVHPQFPESFTIDRLPADRTKNVINRIKSNIMRRFGNYRLFGLKNPLVTLLLPLYKKAFNELGYGLKLIVVLRDPLEIALSIQKRTKRSLGSVLNVVELYLTSLANSIKNCQQISISFDELINNTENTVNKIAEFIPGLKRYHRVKREINSFLVKDLKHHNEPDPEALSPDELTKYLQCKKIYEQLSIYNSK
jgi:hypothetical protein